MQFPLELTAVITNFNLELTLNLMWACLSAALIIVSVRPVLRNRQKQQQLVIVVTVIALICMLFPLISITDDLNSGSVYAESPRTYEWGFGGHAVAALWFPVLDVFSSENTRHNLEVNSLQPLPQSDAFTFNLSRRPPPFLA